MIPRVIIDECPKVLFITSCRDSVGVTYITVNEFKRINYSINGRKRLSNMLALTQTSHFEEGLDLGLGIRFKLIIFLMVPKFICPSLPCQILHDSTFKIVGDEILSK